MITSPPYPTPRGVSEIAHPTDLSKLYFSHQSTDASLIFTLSISVSISLRLASNPYLWYLLFHGFKEG